MKNAVSPRDFFFLVLTLTISTIQIFGIGGELRQDAWIPVLLSPLLAVPQMAMYARMSTLMPGENLFQMAEYALGKAPGKVYSALFSIYAMHVTALVLCNVGLFAQVNSLPKTPYPITLMVLLLPALYIAKSGTRTLGKWAFVLFCMAVTLLALNTALSATIMNPDYLRPVMEHPLERILPTSAAYLAYPYGETIFLMSMIGDVQPVPGRTNPQTKKRFPYRNLVLGTIAAGLYLTVVTLRSIMVLGPSFSGSAFMSAFKSVSVIKVGTYLQRVEALMGMALLLYGAVKLAICIVASARAAASVVSRTATVDMTIPCAVLALAAAPILFQNNVQMYNFKVIYQIYAPVIQIAIPLVIWVIMEIRVRRSGRASAAAPA